MCAEVGTAPGLVPVGLEGGALAEAVGSQSAPTQGNDRFSQERHS